MGEAYVEKVWPRGSQPGHFSKQHLALGVQLKAVMFKFFESLEATARYTTSWYNEFIQVIKSE